MEKYLIPLIVWVSVLSCSRDPVQDMRGMVSIRCAVGVRVGFNSIDTIGPVADHMGIGDTVLVHHAGWSWPTPREYIITGVFYLSQRH